MVVGNVNTLTPALAQRWGIDLAQAAAHAEVARSLPDMSGIWPAVFARPQEPAPDVDQDLYGGFVGNNDRHHLNDLRTMSGARLATARTGFDDPRLTELVWRYRARNFPETLTPEEQERWEAHRAACLFDGRAGRARWSSCLRRSTRSLKPLTTSARRTFWVRCTITPNTSRPSADPAHRAGHPGALNAFFSFPVFAFATMSTKPAVDFTTQIVHADRWGGAEKGAIHQAIHSSVQYGYDQVEDLIAVFQGTAKGGYNYARQGTPTTAALEAKITQMEGGTGSIVFLPAWLRCAPCSSRC